MSFKRAEKKNGRLRLAISGVSGAGKTYSALLFAKEFLSPGGKIAVLDSERGSASLYADLVPFDVEELEDTSIQEYLEKIRDAAQAGYEVLVLDSYSHSWMSALEAIDKSGGWGKGGKTISPLIARLVAAILSYPGHVIATMRAKTDYQVETNDAGRITGMKKMGVGPVARPDTEYEFTVWIDVTREGAITISKTRCSAIEGYVYRRGSKDEASDIPKIAHTLKSWLLEGASVTPFDDLEQRVRASASNADLAALTEEIKALSAEERTRLQPIYMKRKAALAEVAE